MASASSMPGTASAVASRAAVDAPKVWCAAAPAPPRLRLLLPPLKPLLLGAPKLLVLVLVLLLLYMFGREMRKGWPWNSMPLKPMAMSAHSALANSTKA